MIHQHPGADQDAPERCFAGPVGTVPNLGEAGPVETKTKEEQVGVNGGAFFAFLFLNCAVTQEQEVFI